MKNFYSLIALLYTMGSCIFFVRLGTEISDGWINLGALLFLILSLLLLNENEYGQD